MWRRLNYGFNSFLPRGSSTCHTTHCNRFQRAAGLEGLWPARTHGVSPFTHRLHLQIVSPSVPPRGPAHLFSAEINNSCQPSTVASRAAGRHWALEVLRKGDQPSHLARVITIARPRFAVRPLHSPSSPLADSLALADKPPPPKPFACQHLGLRRLRSGAVPVHPVLRRVVCCCLCSVVEFPNSPVVVCAQAS
jgi:hypothetical protein